MSLVPGDDRPLVIVVVNQLCFVGAFIETERTTVNQEFQETVVSSSGITNRSLRYSGFSSAKRCQVIVIVSVYRIDRFL